MQGGRACCAGPGEEAWGTGAALSRQLLHLGGEMGHSSCPAARTARPPFTAPPPSHAHRSTRWLCGRRIRRARPARCWRCRCCGCASACTPWQSCWQAGKRLALTWWRRCRQSLRSEAGVCTGGWWEFRPWPVGRDNKVVAPPPPPARGCSDATLWCCMSSGDTPGPSTVCYRPASSV